MNYGCCTNIHGEHVKKKTTIQKNVTRNDMVFVHHIHCNSIFNCILNKHWHNFQFNFCECLCSLSLFLSPLFPSLYCILYAYRMDCVYWILWFRVNAWKFFGKRWIYLLAADVAATVTIVVVVVKR